MRDGYQQRERRDSYSRHEGRHHRRHGTGEREKDNARARDKEERDKKDRKITKGLLGAGALAGLMDILGGLDGI